MFWSVFDQAEDGEHQANMKIVNVGVEIHWTLKNAWAGSIGRPSRDKTCKKSSGRLKGILTWAFQWMVDECVAQCT